MVASAMELRVIRSGHSPWKDDEPVAKKMFYRFGRHAPVADACLANRARVSLANDQGSGPPNSLFCAAEVGGCRRYGRWKPERPPARASVARTNPSASCANPKSSRAG